VVDRRERAQLGDLLDEARGRERKRGEDPDRGIRTATLGRSVGVAGYNFLYVIKEADMTFLQEPAERPYGIEALFRDRLGSTGRHGADLSGRRLRDRAGCRAGGRDGVGQLESVGLTPLGAPTWRLTWGLSRAVTGPSRSGHDAAIVHIRVLTIDEAWAILVASGIDEDEIPTEEFTGY
jgi:hypothetical protein